MPDRPSRPGVPSFEQKEGQHLERLPENPAKNSITNIAQKVNQLLTDRPDLTEASFLEIMRELQIPFDTAVVTSRMNIIEKELQNHYRVTVTIDEETKEERETGLTPFYFLDTEHPKESFSKDAENLPNKKDIENIFRLSDKVKKMRDDMIDIFLVLKSLVEYYEKNGKTVPEEISGYYSDYSKALDNYNFYLSSLQALRDELMEKRTKNLFKTAAFYESIGAILDYFASLSDKEERTDKLDSKEMIKTLEKLDRDIQQGVQTMESIQQEQTDAKQTIAEMFASEAKKYERKNAIPEIYRLEADSKKRRTLEQTFSAEKISEEKRKEILDFAKLVLKFYKINSQINNLNTKLKEIENSKDNAKRREAGEFKEKNRSLLANLRLIQSQILEKLNTIIPYLIVFETTNLLRRNKAEIPALLKPGSNFDKFKIEKKK